MMTAPTTINEHVFIRRFSVVDYDLFLVMSERVAHFNQECKGDFSLQRIADLSHEIIGSKGAGKMLEPAVSLDMKRQIERRKRKWGHRKALSGVSVICIVIVDSEHSPALRWQALIEAAKFD